jgi:hypothetical protein
MPPDAGCYRVPGTHRSLNPRPGDLSLRRLAVGCQENLRCSKPEAHKVGHSAELLPTFSWHPTAKRQSARHPDSQPGGGGGSLTNRRKESQARVTVAIAHGLFGRPVPSGLLPSWPSPAMDATTSRDALSIVPKIVKFGF